MRFLLLFFVIVLLLIATSGCTSWLIERNHPALGSFLDVEGQTIHYLDIGPKNTGSPPLVILHGASANLNDTKMALGDALAEKYRVILVDRPGRGYSTRPADGYKLDVQARLIHGLLQKLEVADPIVIGQSLGGAVALSYTLNYQESMAGTVLLAPVSHGWPGDVVWYNRMSSHPIFGFILRRTIVPYYGQLVAPKGVDGTFWPQPAPDNYFERAGIPLLFRPRDFKSNAADVSNLKSQVIEMAERYSDINIPVSIFVGTHDTTVSPTIHSYTLSQQIEGSKLTILENTGHGLHHTASEEILAGIDMMSDSIVIARANERIEAPTVSSN